MAIEVPPLVEVNAGDPLTSESWNLIIVALRRLFEAANETGTLLSVRVIDGDGSAVTHAVLTLVGKGGVTRVGMYAGGEVRRYVVPGISDGAWLLNVEAEGFAVEKREIEIAGSSRELDIEMTRIKLESGVPDLFGQNLVEASSRLQDAGFRPGIVLDAHGRELTKRDLIEGAERYVLGQSPDAGLAHERGGAVNLAVTAAPIVEERIRVPNVTGMSLDEARRTLQDAGWLVGTVDSVSK